MPTSPATAEKRPKPGQPVQGDPQDVPDRPELAPSVVIRGMLEDSGFLEPQWLIARDGQYIQLTELLFRIAEQIDGQRTLDDIAYHVSEAIDRRVSAANVRQLIATKLIPLGLVRKADGTIVPARAGRARSPLAVNMRMAMVSPDVSQRLAAAFQVLYRPPILLAILLAALATQAWLYLVYGVASSFHDALYNPGLLLLILGAIILSAAFHEIGHAAALSYGGGKVRGMGAGLYLVYPAFYTDVTDNYRLRRWARVRTDLGGFYFNLIFALGVMGLYLVTGFEFLLVIVVLINLEIIHQLLPFVRLDGYWALADLTGIPDFFSHIGAFLRTVLPIPGWQGRKLPPLKTWARAVFALYILSVIPLLILLLFLTVKGLPRILATAWASFLKQKDALTQAVGSADILGSLAAGFQAVLLIIPTVGILWVLLTVGRRLAGGVWAWSEDSVPRRAVAGAGTLGIAGLLAFLWAPQLPFEMNGQPEGVIYGRTVEIFRPMQPDERGAVTDLFAETVSTRPRHSALIPARPHDESGTNDPTDQAGGVMTGTATIAPSGVVTESEAVTPGESVTETPVITGTPTVAPGEIITRTPTALPGTVAMGSPTMTPDLVVTGTQTALPSARFSRTPTAVTATVSPRPNVTPTTIPRLPSVTPVIGPSPAITGTAALPWIVPAATQTPSPAAGMLADPSPETEPMTTGTSPAATESALGPTPTATALSTEVTPESPRPAGTEAAPSASTPASVQSSPTPAAGGSNEN